jgi:glycosyltransferase involved in cell wall biosynthesis
MDLIVEAFGRMPGRRLVVIGGGPGRRRLARAAGPNVRLLGHVPQETLRSWLQQARAFVFAAEEDFGILPVEAQACGTPVIAFGRGGATETVRDGQTGVLFTPQTPEALAAAVQRFEAAGPWDRQAIRANAERFGVERFRREFRAILDRKLAAFRQGGDVEADADAP